MHVVLKPFSGSGNFQRWYPLGKYVAPQQIHLLGIQPKHIWVMALGACFPPRFIIIPAEVLGTTKVYGDLCSGFGDVWNIRKLMNGWCMLSNYISSHTVNRLLFVMYQFSSVLTMTKLRSDKYKYTFSIDYLKPILKLVKRLVSIIAQLL